MADLGRQAIAYVFGFLTALFSLGVWWWLGLIPCGAR